MRIDFQQLYLKLQYLLKDDGQDLIEYALIIAFVALACTAGMTSLAGSINAAFVSLGTSLTGAVA